MLLGRKTSTNKQANPTFRLGSLHALSNWLLRPVFSKEVQVRFSRVDEVHCTNKHCFLIAKDDHYSGQTAITETTKSSVYECHAEGCRFGAIGVSTLAVPWVSFVCGVCGTVCTVSGPHTILRSVACVLCYAGFSFNGVHWLVVTARTHGGFTVMPHWYIILWVL